MSNKKRKNQRKKQNQSRQSQPSKPSTPVQPVTPTQPTQPTTPNQPFSLDRVKEEGLAYLINESVSKTKNPAEEVEPWLQGYVAPREEESLVTDMRNLLEINPETIRSLALKYQARHEKNMIEKVSKGYGTVLENITPDYVTTIAKNFFGNEKDKQLRYAIKEEKEKIKPIFADLYDREIWKDVVSRSPRDAIQTAAEMHISTMIAKELTDKLTDNGTFNMRKAATYAATNVNTSLSQEQKIALYKEAGILYTKIQDPTFFE